MCIAVFIWQANPKYPLILLHNRDEYHSRPTKPAYWWESGEILGGRDEVAGGTWLACSRSGRLAFVTNFRERESIANAKSRGDLPVRFLQTKKPPIEFAEELIQEAHQYNGYNLILADFGAKSMVYVTNRPKENEPCVFQVSPGIHVLTSANLDTPWPKAERLRHNFKDYTDSNGESEFCANDMVETLMRDTTKADQDSLPGIYPPNFEHQLSSIFIDTDSPNGRYGTRSTVVVMVKTSGEVCFHERYLEEDAWKEHTLMYQTKQETK